MLFLRARSQSLAAIATVTLIVLGTTAFTSAGTFHFNQADVNLGRILQGATPSTNLTLARGSNGNTTVTYSYTAGLTGPSSSTGSGMLPPPAITVALQNTASGTASPFTGVRQWTVTMAGEVTGGQDTAVNVSATVLAPSNGSFLGTGNQDTLTLDFGTVLQNSSQSLGFSLFNLEPSVGFTAKLDLDSVVETGDVSGKFSTNLPATPSLNLLTAGSNAAYNVSFNTTTLGAFTATYTLSTSDENVSGATNGTPLVITVLGTVVAMPEPTTIGLAAIAAGAMLRRRRS